MRLPVAAGDRAGGPGRESRQQQQQPRTEREKRGTYTLLSFFLSFFLCRSERERIYEVMRAFISAAISMGRWKLEYI